MRKLLLLALLFVLSISLPAAAQESGNLVDSAALDSNLTTFVAALEISGVAETLRGPDTFTVFAPTNEAFAEMLALLGITSDELFADTNRLRALALNHVTSGNLTSADLLSTPALLTVSNNTLSVSSVDNTLLIGNIGRVVSRDIVATNGVIHTIDRVLLPPAEATAVAQVTPIVVTPVVVTPTVAMATELPQQAMAAPSFLRVAHFSPDSPSVDVFVDNVLSDIAGLAFGQVTDWMPFPASTYTFAFAPQGSLIEEAIYGPVDVVIAPGTWTTLAVLGSQAEQTVRVAVIDETMQEPLAPENARVTLFNAVENGPNLSLAVGDNIVLVDNVAYGDYTSLDIPVSEYDFQVHDSGTGVPLAGLPDVVLLPGAHYLIGATGTTAAPGIAIKAAPRELLDALLAGQQLPQEITAVAVADDVNLLDAAAADGRFTILLTAIQAAQLEDTLRSPGPFTLLAPTDEAFAALPEGMMDALLMNQTALQNLLLYHLLVGEFSARDLTNQTSFLTALGVPITVTQEDTLAMLNDGVVFMDTDIPASNGVIHVIDAVLLPPTP